MSTSRYRVHVHDHADQGRWLAQADFPRRPTAEQVTAAFPVLSQPGRYEVRLCLLSGESEIYAGAWLQGESQDRVAPGTVQVKRDGIVQETFAGPDPVQNSNDAFAWLLRHQGQSVDWATRHEGWEITDPAAGCCGECSS